MNDLVQDYLGKAVQIKPRKGIGYIIDRDPTDNSFLVMFTEEKQVWAKVEKLEFPKKPGKKVTFVDFDGEDSNASPSMHISKDEIIIYRPVFSDPGATPEAMMSMIVGDSISAQNPMFQDRLLDLIDELGLSFNIGNALVSAITFNNPEMALNSLEREVRRKK